MSVEADWFLRAHPEITTIEALLPDCNGIMRGKWLPRHKLDKIFSGELKLPKTALSLDIWGRDVEVLVFATGDADGLCRAVEGTLLPTPWAAEGKHGQLLLSMYNADGSPYSGDPAHVLAQVVQRFKKKGLRPVMAAELEFSLVTWDAQVLKHSCPAPAGSSPVGGNTYGVDVFNTHLEMLEDLRVACEIQDLPFDGVVKESAPSQYEINMQHVDDPMLAARQIVLLKRLVKGVCAKHGLIASFMAKPFEQEAGNGMHVHCSLLDESGSNVFNDGSDQGSELLRHAIGGCLAHMSDSMAIFSPHYNSYRRFTPGCHAPISPSWGHENRTVSVRIPAGSTQARRLEHRVAGADTNPYLLFAVLLSSILDGLDQHTDPGDPIAGDGYEQATHELPVYMHEAVEKFRQSTFIKSSLGAEFQRIFTLTKEQEINEFRQRISALEYQSYLQQL